MERTVYFGVVTDVEDPDGLGRIKVKFPEFGDETVASAWLRVLHPAASASFGHFFLPERDDEVAVLRGGDDAFGAMLVLGAVYNGVNKPKTVDIASGVLNTSQLVTRSGHELTFVDKSGEESITLQTKDGKYALVLDVQNQKLDVTSDQKINVTGGADVTIKAGTAKINVEAGSITIKSSSGAITIESGAGVTVKGNSPVEVSSSAILTLKGSMVKIG